MYIHNMIQPHLSDIYICNFSYMSYNPILIIVGAMTVTA